MPLSALQILLVAGAVQGCCLSILLFTRQENRLANRLLGFLILLFSFQSVLVGFDTREFFLTFPHLSKVSWVLPTLFGPLLFLFTKKLTSEHARLRPDEAIHLLPLLTYLVLLAPYFLQSAEAKSLYLNNFEKASVDDFGLLNQVRLPTASICFTRSEPCCSSADMSIMCCRIFRSSARYVCVG